MNRYICIIFTYIVIFVSPVLAHDSIQHVQEVVLPTPKISFWSRAYDVIKEFSRVDTNYIEPQQYNYAVMIQNTNTYESYRLRDKDGNSINLSPNPSVKFGPYVGWRWLFLGYTIDFFHLGSGKMKQDFDFSIYSNQVGVDLFYRQTGNNYKIHRMEIKENKNTLQMKDLSFGGFSASIKGINLYYIFNHKKFSYPAAFSQSTRQKRSAASFLMGVGYTKHSLSLNIRQVRDIVKENLKEEIKFDSTYQSAKVSYSDVSVSAGWAYNWVFAKNWLFAASLSGAIAYKRATGDKQAKWFSFRDFTFDNFNIDGIGRFGIVWNDAKYFIGANAIFHAYNYNKSQFSTNTLFGNLNIYAGFNFGNRHRKHKAKNK